MRHLSRFLVIVLVGCGQPQQSVKQAQPPAQPPAAPSSRAPIAAAPDSPATIAPAPRVPAQVEKQDEPQPVNPATPGSATGGVSKATLDRTAIESTLRQLGISFKNFEVLNGRAPKSQKEFAPFYDNNAAINESLTRKHIAFPWGAGTTPFPEGKEKTVLAYETEADKQGLRFVLMGNGAVRTLDEKQFKATPKVMGAAP